MARKIAPGFLDNEDRRILTPTLATVQANTNIKETSSNTRAGRYNDIDYSVFEQSDNNNVGSSSTATASEIRDTLKEDVSPDRLWQQKHNDDQRGSSVSPSQDDRGEDVNEVRVTESTTTTTTTMDGREEIVQAVPWEAITGMLRNNRIEDDAPTPSPPPPPRAWGNGLEGVEVTRSRSLLWSCFALSSPSKPSWSSHRLLFRNLHYCRKRRRDWTFVSLSKDWDHPTRGILQWMIWRL